MKLILSLSALITILGIANSEYWSNDDGDTWDEGDDIAITGDFWRPNFEGHTGLENGASEDRFYRGLFEFFRQQLRDLEALNGCNHSATPTPQTVTGPASVDLTSNATDETQVITTPVVPPTSSSIPESTSSGGAEVVPFSNSPSARARPGRSGSSVPNQQRSKSHTPLRSRSQKNQLKDTRSKYARNRSNRANFKSQKDHGKARELESNAINNN